MWSRLVAPSQEARSGQVSAVWCAEFWRRETGTGDLNTYTFLNFNTILILFSEMILKQYECLFIYLLVYLFIIGITNEQQAQLTGEAKCCILFC